MHAQSYSADNPLSDAIVVIMAGGAGTRFWPVSTEQRPKQFLALLGERTLLQQSYDRVIDLVPPERILVLTAARFVDLVREQLPALPAANIVGEPLRRDTSAAIGLAAALCQQRFGDGVMAVLTSDHLIRPVDLFQADLRSAYQGALASPEALYTFGIPPSYAATSYGYLQCGAALKTPWCDGGELHYKVQRFQEKPDAATAQRYVDSGEYYWNSGMFIWRLGAIIAEMERNLPEHAKLLAAAAAADGTSNWPGMLEQAFATLEPISIDYGVMERARDVRCVAARFSWSDVGGWLALEEFLGHDDQGNSCRGQLHVRDASDNVVFCEDDAEHVALIGVTGLVVVRCNDRTLVVQRSRAEEIKHLVKKLDASLR